MVIHRVRERKELLRIVAAAYETIRRIMHHVHQLHGPKEAERCLYWYQSLKAACPLSCADGGAYFSISYT